MVFASQGRRAFSGQKHAEMTVRLIEAVRTELGEPALDRINSGARTKTKAAYAAELAGSMDLRESALRLAAIRSREGQHGGGTVTTLRFFDRRKPLSDMRCGAGLPRILPRRTGDGFSRRGPGAGSSREADGSHPRRRTSLRLSDIGLFEGDRQCGKTRPRLCRTEVQTNAVVRPPLVARSSEWRAEIGVSRLRQSRSHGAIR